MPPFDVVQLPEKIFAGGNAAVGAVVIMKTQAHLLDVIRALGGGAASRAACTAGNKRAIKTAMIAITTRSSMRVKPRDVRIRKTPR